MKDTDRESDCHHNDKLLLSRTLRIPSSEMADSKISHTKKKNKKKSDQRLQTLARTAFVECILCGVCVLVCYIIRTATL